MPSFWRWRPDAGIGLMRHQPVDLVSLHPDILEHLAQHRGQVGDGMAKHLAALHAQLAHSARGARAAIDIEQLVVRPSACRRVARMPGACGSSLSRASSTMAPAPSPNSTQVARSSQSRMR
jgi:hypothetical protein